MSTRRAALASGTGGALLLVSLALPWFSRRLSSLFSPVEAEQTESGWHALGTGQGILVAVVALVALAWAFPRGRRVSGAWLVIGGGLVLMAEVGTMVAKVGADDNGGAAQVVSTTTPSFGLAVAFAGGLAVVLAGIYSLVSYARERTAAERAEPG